jgi:hypothetical protein
MIGMFMLLMACFTMVRVDLEDDVWNRKARKNLGLPLEGSLSALNAQRVTREASVLKTIATTKRLAPNAVIRRKGNKIKVTVSR